MGLEKWWPYSNDTYNPQLNNSALSLMNISQQTTAAGASNATPKTYNTNTIMKQEYFILF